MILGYHITPDGIYVSNGKHQATSPYVDFMLLNGQGNINVCYHLDYCFSVLCKLLQLTDTQLTDIYNTSNLNISGYKFHYIPKKFLSIAHDNKFAIWSDASQYMDRWDIKHGTAQEKCKEAFTIATEVHNALWKLGIRPTTLISPISAFDKKYLDTLNLPVIEDVPTEVSEYAYHCTRGPWIESFKRGYFENVYDYDLSSAYPSMLAQLIDPRLGTWVKDNHWHNDAYYGYVYGLINVTANFSPVIYSKHHESSHTPIGEWTDYFAKQEIDYVKKYKKGEFELVDGWWYFPTKIIYPLKPMILWLYDKKEKATGLEKKVIKRISSALWGRLLQVNFGEVPGERFFPVWGEEVECNTRLEVARFVDDNDLFNNLLCITVDGVLTTKEVKV